MGHKRVLHVRDDLGVKKPRKEDIISSDKSKPDAEGLKVANETLLKVQISKFALRCMAHPYNAYRDTYRAVWFLYG